MLSQVGKAGCIFSLALPVKNRALEGGRDCKSHSHSDKEVTCLNHLLKCLDVIPGPIMEVPHSPKL